MNNPFEQSLEEIEQEIRIRLARQNLIDYEEYVNPNYKRSRFHKFLCDKIQRFMENDVSDSFDILLLSVPPQHGKSLTVTETLPAWYLGKHPDKKWIIASYNSEFAMNFGRKNRQKCEEFNTKIFKDFKLAENPCNNVEFETTKKGGLYSAGILAGLTGHTADYFIIDDPIKTAGEAASSTTKDSIWSEYLSSVRTRIKPHGKLIIIQTRWVEDDLYGRVAENEKNTTIINIPCECDDPENDPLGRALGDALCPEIGRGNEWLKEFKNVYKSKEGSRAWTSLYQGKPTALEGNMVKREWWRYYSPDDIKDLPYKIMSVDATFKGGEDNDYVAIQVWGKKNGKHYLLYRIKEHLDFVQTVEAIRDTLKKYPDIMYTLIEDKANGSAIINVLSAEFEGIIPIKPEGGKVSRLNAVSPAIERGDVLLPKHESWVKDYIDEFSAFPNGAHDDEVDSTSQALTRMLFVDADVVNKSSIKYSFWSDDMWEDYDRAGDELKVELLNLWGHPLEWMPDDEE